MEVGNEQEVKKTLLAIISKCRTLDASDHCKKGASRGKISTIFVGKTMPDSGEAGDPTETRAELAVFDMFRVAT